MPFRCKQAFPREGRSVSLTTYRLLGPPAVRPSVLHRHSVLQPQEYIYFLNLFPLAIKTISHFILCSCSTFFYFYLFSSTSSCNHYFRGHVLMAVSTILHSQNQPPSLGFHSILLSLYLSMHSNLSYFLLFTI
jgi:hypothetical protein